MGERASGAGQGPDALQCRRFRRRDRCGIGGSQGRTWADAAALVVARAHLEQYRQRADAEDLTAARAALGAVRASALMPRDQVDLIVGLGQSLYLSEIYGAAAELFDTALSRAALLASRDRLLLLDWWATALDREAQSRPADRRARVFERIAARMNEEIQRDPGSPVANYWLAVSARGAGDIDGAWNSAIAAWVRSTLSPETTEQTAGRSRSPGGAGADTGAVAHPRRARPAGRGRGARDRVGAVRASGSEAGRGTVRLRLRVPPVFADSDIDRQRHAE